MDLRILTRIKKPPNIVKTLRKEWGEIDHKTGCLLSQTACRWLPQATAPVIPILLEAGVLRIL